MRRTPLAFVALNLATVYAEEATAVPTHQFDLITQALILLGSFFILAAAIGVIRFPDFYTRLHASTKLVTLGGLGIFVGTAVAFQDVRVIDRIVLITLFFFLTAPLSAYMIARAGYLQGLKPYREDASVDEWGICGEAALEDAESPQHS